VFTSSSVPHIHAVSGYGSAPLDFFTSSKVGRPLGNFCMAMSIMGYREFNFNEEF
jgi:hypothetical protein